MKKYQIILISVFGALVLLLLISRLTNGLQYYVVPTRSNEPTFKTGSHFLASNLLKPQRFDFICYKTSAAEHENQIWFHRICGMPGDIVEIKNGDLFVNGVSRDGSLNLKKLYVIPYAIAVDLDFEEGEAIPIPGDSILAPLETIKQKDVIQKCRLYIDPKEDPAIHSTYGKPWSPYNFGPYTVPDNTYFVMGDNRYRSMDSRYNGPVEKKNYLTTLFTK